jgi:uncharacterized protein YkwD/ribosomal protein L37AE/L43A
MQRSILVWQMSEENIDVCPECATRHFDRTPRSLYVCEYCGRLMCRVHKDARLVHIRSLLGDYRSTKWGRAILAELEKKNGHPCFQYTHIFWKNFDAQNEKEFVLRKKALGYLAGHPSFTKPPETSTKEETPSEQEEPIVYTSEGKTSRLGLCPQCHRCSDKIVDYDAKTITFQCERCGFKFSQLKATPHDYVEPPEKPEPIEKPTSIEPTIKQKHVPLKKVIALLAIAIVIGVLIWSAYPHLLQLTQSRSVSPNPSTTPSLPSTTPTNTLPETPSHEELTNYALSLINSDRQSHGLQNVTLSSVDSGQRHADDMLANNFFSHWDTNGYKPYMRYTIADGKGAVAENCAWEGLTGNIFGIDVKSALKDMERNMMYDDASSNWGHRDNILDPLHNRVSIGVAYDNQNVYLVQDFENDYVSWNVLNVNNNQVTLQGTIQGQQSDIKQIAVFYDNPTPLTPSQLKQAPYQDGYDAGTYVGLALPPNWQATGGITLTADSWTQNGNNFQISFSLSQVGAAFGKGVYTLYLETGSSTADALLTYSVWIN